MTKIYFVDEQHEENYRNMKEMFPKALYSKEYQSACYISSTPIIFSKFEDKVSNFSDPVCWIYSWEDRYLPKQCNETNEEYEERTNVGIDYDLTSSMQQMGKLALNLWNGYANFNLMDCLDSVDYENYLVVKQAINIRMGDMG